jgi:hypothetical protein
MFELISIVGVMLIIGTMMLHHRAGKQRAGKDEMDEGQGRSEPRRPVVVEPVLRGSKDGRLTAVPRDARFGFITAFGLHPDYLKELHVYSVAGRTEEFPKKVSDLLYKLYNNGFAVGEEIMAVLHHDRPLKVGEAIYVAVVRDQRSNAQRTVAFIDRYRTC